MKKTIKVLSLLLALLMLGSTLVACGGDDTTQGGGGTPGGEVIKNDDPYADELPALNYEGATVSILCSAKDTVTDEFYAEGASTNTISNAVFKRNEQVKSRLGVELNVIHDKDSAANINKINTKLEDAVLAGDNSYDIVSGATYLTTASVNKDNYRNLYNCDYINLNKSYWSQGFNQAFSYGTDRQYLATGSIAISIYRFMYCTIFNKEMFEAIQEPELYGAVDSGDWTLEYQTTLSKKFENVTSDPENSTYGTAVGLHISIDPYWVSLDVPVVSKDNNNQFVFNMNQKSSLEKLSNAVDLILKLYLDQSAYVVDVDNDGFTNKGKTIQMFYEQKAAMATTIFYNIERSTNELADMDYGIVPMPKYNKDQQNYYSAVQDQVSALGISKTVTDDRLQMVGAVLEALASESYKTVVDEYYGSVMNYRLLQDPESQDMLTLIYEGSRMTMTAVYTGVMNTGLNSGFTTFLRNLIIVGYGSAGYNGTSSKFSSVKKALDTNVKTLNTAFTELEAKKAS